MARRKIPSPDWTAVKPMTLPDGARVPMMMARDVQVFQGLCGAETGLVAMRFKMTVGGLEGLIHRIKDRYHLYRWYVNCMEGMRGRYEHIDRKLKRVRIERLDAEEEEAMRDVTEIEVVPQKPRRRRKPLVYIKGEQKNE